MRVLGLVPARGGSKGIPGKNIRPLAGKPLLYYTAVCARQARTLSQVVLSTDDEAIAELGRSFGLEVPFLRPAPLAQDDTPTLPVVQHAVAFLEEQGERFDAVCLLQPTSPLRKPQDIDACVRLLEESGADAVVSVGLVPEKYNPHWVYLRDHDGFLSLSTGEDMPIARRQELPPAFYRDGAIFLVRRDTCMDQGSLYGRRLMGYLAETSTHIDIDTLQDLERVEWLLTHQQT